MSAAVLDAAPTTTAVAPVPYGLCPVCGANGVVRGRRRNGLDVCANGHTYRSDRAESTQAFFVDGDGPFKQPCEAEFQQFRRERRTASLTIGKQFAFFRDGDEGTQVGPNPEDVEFKDPRAGHIVEIVAVTLKDNGRKQRWAKLCRGRWNNQKPYGKAFRVNGSELWS